MSVEVSTPGSGYYLYTASGHLRLYDAEFIVFHLRSSAPSSWHAVIDLRGAEVDDRALAVLITAALDHDHVRQPDFALLVEGEHALNDRLARLSLPERPLRIRAFETIDEALAWLFIEVGVAHPAAAALDGLQSVRGNRLLRALPEEELAEIGPQLEQVELQSGQVIDEPMRALAWVYFPVTSLIAVRWAGADKRSVEIGLVGNEGLVGCSVLLGAADAPTEAVVVSGGFALRAPAAVMVSASIERPVLRRVALSASASLLCQAMQMVACKERHQARARIATRMRELWDRRGNDSVHTTPTMLAESLGLSPSRIGRAVSPLIQGGTLLAEDDLLTIADPEALRAQACACYAQSAQRIGVAFA